MIRKTLLFAGLGAALAMAGTAAEALTLSFAPSAQTQFAGQTASVDVVLSGLAAQDQIISGFDIDVSFTGSPTVSFLGADYSDALGVVDVDTISFPGVDVGGTVELVHFSFLPDADLDARQGDSVTLATLRFRSLLPASTTLSFSFDPAIDITGRQVPGSDPAVPTLLEPDAATGRISWIARDGQIPVPATAWLVFAALGALGLLRRARTVA